MNPDTARHRPFLSTYVLQPNQPSLFEGNAAVDLSLQNALLQREIGYWWTPRSPAPADRRRCSSLPRPCWTLGQRFAEGQEAENGGDGHLSARRQRRPRYYAFCGGESGNGTARIYVYDNNWPMDSRFVEVDRATTLRYWHLTARITGQPLFRQCQHQKSGDRLTLLRAWEFSSAISAEMKMLRPAKPPEEHADLQSGKGLRPGHG